MTSNKIQQNHGVCASVPKSCHSTADPLETDSQLITYKAAQLRKNKSGYLIEYYALKGDKLERCRMKLNDIRKRYARHADFKQYAESLCHKLNKRLATGWSPFAETKNSMQSKTLREVADLYLEEKSKELRAATMRSYASFCSMFVAWSEKELPEVRVGNLSRVEVVRYMDYIYKEKQVGVRTYNNTLKMGRAFFTYAVEKCYTDKNPFTEIKVKREEEKTRILIPKDYRDAVTEYLGRTNRGYLLVCQLVFGALMRPKEIRMIQAKHIDFAKKCVVVPADNAKNHHQRFAPINDDIIALMKERNAETLPGDTYLIGWDWEPSARMLPDAAMTKEWVKVRNALHLPKELQLYSLRDTGINGMLKAGIDPLTVMQAADHHDLSMTTRYANHADENLIGKIREKAPKF